jgi:pimeloyl-ACP methyl ester carboxylesterase
MRATLDFSAVDAMPRTSVGGGVMVTARQSDSPSGRPMMLFVPGAFHGAWCYAHYLEYFSAAGLDCAALDLPGHGSAPVPADFARYGVRELADCVVQACELLRRPVVLVGHSMGALPVMVAAAQRPPAAVVLLAPSPPANVPGAAAIPAVPEGVLRPPPGAPEVRKRFAGVGPDIDVTAVQARLTAESPQVMNDRYLLRIAVPEQAIHVPGLVVEAELDDPARHPAGQDQAIASLYGFDYRLLPATPHCMMYAENWRASADRLKAWFMGHNDHTGD